MSLYSSALAEISTELLVVSAVMRTFGNCGADDPPWPRVESSELSAATGRAPNWAAALPAAPGDGGGVGSFIVGGLPPVSRSVGVSAFVPDDGAISLAAEPAPAEATNIWFSN